MAKSKVKEVAETSNPFEKLKALKDGLNKHYGKNLVRSGDEIPYINKVPFGEPVIDYIYSGGIPIGRFTEMLGHEHSGKTRNGLRAMGQFQKYCFGCNTPDVLETVWEIVDDFPEIVTCSCANCDSPETRVMVMVDIEGTTDPKFMKALGIDPKGVLYTRPDLPSDAMDIMEAYIRNPLVGLILMDSFGGMGSDKEVKNTMADEKMNQNALSFNRAMRKWQAALNANTNETGLENGITLILVNQSYTTLDFYSRDVPVGGRGLRHGKATSVKTRISEKVKDSKDNVIGVHVKIENLKNKAGVPYRTGEYYLSLEENGDLGYCQTNIALQYVEMGIQFGVIEQKGGWYYFGDEKWQGKTKLLDAIETCPEIKIAVDKLLYGE